MLILHEDPALLGDIFRPPDRGLVRRNSRVVNHLLGSVCSHTLLHCLRCNTIGEIIAVSSPNPKTDEVPTWQVLITDEGS